MRYEIVSTNAGTSSGGGRPDTRLRAACVTTVLLLAALLCAVVASAAMHTGEFVRPHAPLTTGIAVDPQLNNFHVVLNGAASVYPVPLELLPTRDYSFWRTASGRVLYSFKSVPPDSPVACSGGTVVYFHRFPAASGQNLIPVGTLCLANGKAWERFYDAPSASDQQIAVLAERRPSVGGQQNVYWIDLVAGTIGTTQFEPEFDLNVNLTFAPSGNAALVRHHTNTVNLIADYRLVDLCPGRAGMTLSDLRNLGGFATAAVRETRGSFEAVISHPSLPGGSVTVPLTDCLGAAPPPPPNFSLSVDHVGTGTGTVVSSLGGINCGANCHASFAPQTVVSLTAHPDLGSAFDHWGGDCEGRDATTTVRLDSDRICIAYFRSTLADLSVSASAAPDPAVAGGLLTYHIDITNAGPSGATAARASVVLPPGATFEPAASTTGCQLFAGTVSCAVGAFASGELASGASATLRVSVLTDPSARNNLSAMVSVSGGEVDPDSTNNSVTVRNSLVAVGALSLSLTDLPDPAAAGGVLAYRVVVTNSGPSTATGIQMTPTLPADVSLLRGSSLQSCSAGSLGPGESRTFTILARVTALEGATLTAGASATANETDPDLSDNSDSEDTAVGPAATPGGGRFTKIADRDTLAPDSTGLFTFFDRPALSDTGISFVAEVNGQATGVYSWFGGPLQTVADTNTFIPAGGGVRFGGIDIGTVTMDGANVAFGGGGYPLAQNGAFYTDICGVQMAVSNLNQPLNSPAQFTNYVGLTMRDGRLAGWGSGLVPGSIALWENGTVTTLVDHNTLIPGGSDTFFNLANPMLDGSTVVFYGQSPQLSPSGIYHHGLYAAQNGTLTELVGPGSPVPNGSGNFQGVDSFSVIRDRQLAFFGSDAAGRGGIYLRDLATGVTRTVVDADTPIPDSTETFTNIIGFGEYVSLKGGRVAFVGAGSFELLPAPPYFRYKDLGIYLWENGVIRPVIRAGEEVLDGRPAVSFNLGREGLYGNRLAFLVGFGNNPLGYPHDSEAVYLADLSTCGPTVTTPSGTDVSVGCGPISVTFDAVTSAGETTIVPADPATAGTLPGGFALGPNLLAYEIRTTALYHPPVTVCIDVNSVSDSAEFDRLRILHGESGALVDRTILPPDAPAPDFTARRVCARVDSLSPFVVARLDNRAPEARVRSVTVSAGASCAADASVDDGSSDPDGDAITLSQTPAGPYPLGDTLVTLTVTDGRGASAQATATVTVTDDAPPSVNAPLDVLIQTGPGASSCGVPVSDAALGAASAADSCSPVSVSRAGVPAGNLFLVGQTRVTYTATDGAGHTSSATQTVTVVDATPPAISCPSDVTAEFTSEAGAIVVFSPAAGDNCAGAVTLNTSHASGGTYPMGTTTVTATATDAAGNTSACSFDVTIIGPRGVLQNVLDELTALRAGAAARHEREKLDRIRRDLTAALDGRWWLDETRLQPRPGSLLVFFNLGEAVVRLRFMVEHEGNLIPDATLQNFIDRVVRSARQLAAAAISDASAAGGDPEEIARARDDLARGDADVAAGRYAIGIGRFGAGWARGAKAANRGVGL